MELGSAEVDVKDVVVLGITVSMVVITTLLGGGGAELAGGLGVATDGVDATRVESGAAEGVSLGTASGTADPSRSGRACGGVGTWDGLCSDDGKGGVGMSRLCWVLSRCAVSC